MVKLGLIVFANNSGIAIQTRRLAYMLKPYRLLAIDSSGFSKNKVQNWDWYDGFSGYKVRGFPTNREVNKFLEGLTHVLCVENPLNYSLTEQAKQKGIKVFIQTNYEFNDFLDKPHLTLPYKFLMPSYWHIDTMQKLYSKEKVIYLPPPIDPNEFKNAREINFKRRDKKKFLHVIGTLAVHDRNGTLDLLNSLKYSKADFELTIKSQHPLSEEYIFQDHRLRYLIEDTKEIQDIYTDYDAVVTPRRYGGLCLVTNEALLSGLPVIMTNISPNRDLLPKEWLVKAKKTGEFRTRTLIDIYSSNLKDLGTKLDEFAEKDLETDKINAFELGYNNFSPTILKKKYEQLWI